MTIPWPETKFEKILTEISRPETPIADLEYRLLGMRWYGGGLFEKERRKGKDIRATKIYRVEKGDLIYNRLFAWKGSFGIAKATDAGAYVSNEFPCFIINKEVLPEFLNFYMSRSSFWQDVEALSTGASRQSRLRLKQERFLSMKIPLPNILEQQRIVEMAKKVESAIELHRRVGVELEHLKAAVLDQAFRGEL